MSEANDPRPVFDGDWAAASGLERGQHADRVRQWKLRQGLIKPNGQPSEETRTVEPKVERDRARAVRTAWAMIRDDKTPAAVKANLLALVARVEEAQATEKPPSVEALEALSTDQLQALVLAHS